jgi:sulfur transfer protein SufE
MDTTALRDELAALKKQEERFRYLVTSVKSSPEYRKEAMANLEEVRRQIYAVNLELEKANSNCDTPRFRRDF